MIDPGDCYRLPFKYTEGDTLPSLSFTLVDEDITGWTIEGLLDRPDDNSTITKTAVIVDGPQGVFRFDWASTDLVAGCNQVFSVRFTDLGGDVQTMSTRLLIDVEALPS